MKKEAKVNALPLFPLNVVLFPGQSLPLHIFEPRYRVMIQQCMENNEPFGIVLAYEPDIPVEIGTTARVTEVKQLPDGRMDIVTMGESRFRIHSIRQSEHGYLLGEVTIHPFSGEPEQSRTNLLAKAMRRYLQLLSAASGMRLRVDQMPTDPLELALFAAIALRLPLDEKQALLDEETLNGLMQSEIEFLSVENHQTAIAMAAIVPPEDMHGFCRN
jgi:Lon protease-like protein